MAREMGDGRGEREEGRWKMEPAGLKERRDISAD